jgi:hypothetical protein
MITEKKSKRVLRSLINESMKEAVSSLDLPEPSKKVNKVIDRCSKKIAGLYSHLLKREAKKKRKAEKAMAASMSLDGNKKVKRQAKVPVTL